MRSVLDLWRHERGARWFFLAHLQGGLGTGAGYVALLLLAYDRIGSAWAATAVLLADLLPAMLLGPLLGGLIDRISRLRCAVVADVLRAVAFAAILLTGSVVAMIALALLAGVGSALFRPATSALLPSLVPDTRLPAANALYSVMRDCGQLLGPACAGGILLVSGPETVIALNAVTFAASALLLSRLAGHLRPLGAGGAPDDQVPTTVAAGVAAIVREPVTRTLMLTSGAMILAAGTMNIAELVLAEREMRAGGTGFALLVSAYGCGLVGGSLFGARDAGWTGLRRRYLSGLGLMSLGLAGSAAAPVLGLAMLTFAITGAGNGLFLVSDRVMLQRLVPERLQGRAFGLLDSIDSWGFGAALLVGGLIATTAGSRAVFAIAAAGTLLVALAAAHALRTPAPRLTPVLATA
jgi:MFS family permease